MFLAFYIQDLVDFPSIIENRKICISTIHLNQMVQNNMLYFQMHTFSHSLIFCASLKITFANFGCVV
jgi:hypothetical protein